MSIAYNGTVITVPGSPDVTLSALGNGQYVDVNSTPNTAYLQIGFSTLSTQAANPKTKTGGSTSFSITAKKPFLDGEELISHVVSVQMRSGYPNGNFNVATIDYLLAAVSSLVTTNFLNGVLVGKR